MTFGVCDCGAEVPPFTPAEDEHYVFSVRRDGSRSNIGYCPVKWGMPVAIMKARMFLGYGAMYRGQRV
jgi:hypothetical protein